MKTYTAAIHKEGDWYVAECLEIETVSQGKTIEESLRNLVEATELYLEEFPSSENISPSFITTFTAEVHV